MKFKSALPVALAATACLSFVNSSRATVFTEPGATDAGDLPGTALVIPGAAGTGGVNNIIGTTTITNGASDSDMYRFTISGAPVTLTASATTFYLGGYNTFDSQLAVFTITGVGIAANDDSANASGGQASLSVNLTAGTYYLLISGSGRYATDSSGTPGTLIFPNFTDGTTDPTATVAAMSANPISGYTGTSNEGGKYVIALGTAPIPAPEPGTWALVAAAAAGAVVFARTRRNA